MTVVRLERRLGALEAKAGGGYVNLDHLSDAHLELMVKRLRGDVLDALDERGIGLPPEWYRWTQTQQDRWAEARVKELPE